MAASESYRIRVEKDTFVFSAGHFITFDGDHCERLHGHNYRAAVEVSGPLDENRYVFDFIALRDIFAAIVADLDHRMLLPEVSDKIRLHDDEPNWRVTYDRRWWSFPKDECVVLPIENTTTELLARWLGMELLSRFRMKGLTPPGSLTVHLEENFGQWAVWDWRDE
jgi:6-pyruvoyltetrahydropterin/6-carboxytetrahydropterin synthase